jgi:HSP20 family protein
MPEIMPMDRQVVSLRDAMDRLFAQSFTPSGNGPFGDLQRPAAPANVWEDAEGYHVWLLVPGVDLETVQITAQSGVLSISGETKNGAPEGGRAVHQEWQGAKFDRTIRLGTAMDSEKAEASYRDGVLKVHVPKAAHSRPRAIKVTAES